MNLLGNHQLIAAYHVAQRAP